MGAEWSDNGIPTTLPENIEAEADAFLRIQARKPVDASDTVDLLAAKSEIIKLRRAARFYKLHTIAAGQVQATLRMRREQLLFAQKKSATVKMQSLRRSHEVRKEIEHWNEAAKTVQARVRALQARELVARMKVTSNELVDTESSYHQQSVGNITNEKNEDAIVSAAQAIEDTNM